MLELRSASDGNRPRRPLMADLTLLVIASLSVVTVITDVLRWLVELPVAIFHGYDWLVRWVADSVHSLFETYGYWVIFLGTLLENTLLLGLIVPGAVVVLLAGIHSENGNLTLPLALGLGILGTVLGDTISYFLGRFGWERFGQKTSFGDLVEKVREPILRRGTFFILFYHFAGYTRLVGPAAAGVLKMPYRRWAPADYAGASLWVSTYITIGYVLGLAGLSLDSTDRWFRVLEWGLLIIVMIWLLYMYRVGQRAWLEHRSGRRRPRSRKKPRARRRIRLLKAARGG